MPFADLDEVRLHYRFEGHADAPVVVMSNSLGTDLDLWQPQLAALSSRFRVLRYDQRGHGQSSAPAGPYTLASLGQDVAELLSSLNVERAHFCGISMGGLTGLWLGVNRPERVGRLVLANTAARIGTVDSWNTRIDAVTRLGMAAVADAVMARWFTPAFLAADAPPLPALRDTFRRIWVQGYAGCCAALRDADLRAEFGGISAPVLVIAGTHDPGTTPADAHFLADGIAGARYVELPVSHISNVEAPSAFNAALSGFLAA
jgi:3-oxoadipate enol-lactonase